MIASVLALRLSETLSATEGTAKLDKLKYIGPGSDASAAPPFLKQQPCIAVIDAG
jgi:hypothetical protein